MFAASWGLVLLLQALGLFGLDRKWDLDLTLFIVATVLIALGLGVHAGRKPTLMPSRPRRSSFRWLVRILWLAFICESVRQYVWFGSLPLQAAFGHGSRSYIDAATTFNVTETLFVKENIIFLSCAYLVQYVFYRRRRFLLGYLMCASFAIAVLSRAILIPILAEGLLVYVAFARRLARAFLVLVPGAVLASATFGWIEEARFGNFEPYGGRAVERMTGPAIVQKGLERIYEYSVTPLNNVQYNAQLGRFAFMNFELRSFLQRFVPIREVREFLGIGQYAGDENLDLELVGMWNTISFWPAFLVPFGFLGTLFVVGGFLVGFRYMYKAFCRDPGRWLLPVVIVVRVILLGIFTLSLSDPVMLTYFIVGCAFPVMVREADPKGRMTSPGGEGWVRIREVGAGAGHEKVRVGNGGVSRTDEG